MLCGGTFSAVVVAEERRDRAGLAHNSLATSHRLLPRLDLPRQLAQFGNGRAHLGIVAGGAAASTVGLDRSEPFLED